MNNNTKLANILCSYKDNITSKKLIQYTSSSILTYELANKLGYINNYYCYVFEINGNKYGLNGVAEFISKLNDTKKEIVLNAILNNINKNTKDSKTKIVNFIILELSKKKCKISNVSMSKITKLFEISTDNNANICDFLRPNLIINSLFQFANFYDNSDILALWEVGNIFGKNEISRYEKEVMTLCIYYLKLDNTDIAFEFMKRILNTIVSEYSLQEITNNSFNKWKILSGSKCIGTIEDRYDYDCLYYNKQTKNKIMMRVTTIKDEEYIKVNLVYEKMSYFKNEIIEIEEILTKMDELEKTLMKKKMDNDGYYSVFNENTGKFFILKKEMVEFTFIKQTTNDEVFKIPCILALTLNVKKLIL